jgi:demethylmenaquinone methyltransferase/2-methoxy-6-polyprenyl-1,4-benzoquinol methylase
MTDLRRYYADRAAEYEAIYAKPERQADLLALRAEIAAFARGRRVLEIACGTGYWTGALAETAAAVRATDVGEEVLAVARAKGLPPAVTFAVADAFALGPPDGCDAAFAGFWWSHVARVDLARFLDGLWRRLPPRAPVLFADNRYVPGSSTPVARTDAGGDTYQLRTLADGSVHEVRKNFPAAHEVRAALLAAGGVEVAVAESTYFWRARALTP